MLLWILRCMYLFELVLLVFGYIARSEIAGTYSSSIFRTLMCKTEKALATHSSTLAWRLPWMEEPGRLQSMGLQRVRHNWATSLSLSTFMHWRRKWQPTPVFLPGESQGQRSLMGCRLWGSHRVGHNWSDLAAAAVCVRKPCWVLGTLSNLIITTTLKR